MGKPPPAFAWLRGILAWAHITPEQVTVSRKVPYSLGDPFAKSCLGLIAGTVALASAVSTTSAITPAVPKLPGIQKVGYKKARAARARAPPPSSAPSTVKVAVEQSEGLHPRRAPRKSRLWRPDPARRPCRTKPGPSRRPSDPTPTNPSPHALDPARASPPYLPPPPPPARPSVIPELAPAGGEGYQVNPALATRRPRHLQRKAPSSSGRHGSRPRCRPALMWELGGNATQSPPSDDRRRDTGAAPLSNPASATLVFGLSPAASLPPRPPRHPAHPSWMSPFAKKSDAGKAISCILLTLGRRKKYIPPACSVLVRAPAQDEIVIGDIVASDVLQLILGYLTPSRTTLLIYPFVVVHHPPLTLPRRTSVIEMVSRAAKSRKTAACFRAYAIAPLCALVGQGRQPSVALSHSLH
ncbi:hypothetical protein B0H14DRAFT_3462534 [Mycena olivaceomarginata]|nr:hypothetical protein B0H14DRAFT_3462534 [Mycena olivaceomarginata]